MYSILNSADLLSKLDQSLGENGAFDFQQPESSALILGVVRESTAEPVPN